MRNFKMILQYEGTRYKGWQRQESTEHTIQGKLEGILSKMAGTPVEPMQEYMLLDRLLISMRISGCRSRRL